MSSAILVCETGDTRFRGCDRTERGRQAIAPLDTVCLRQTTRGAVDVCAPKRDEPHPDPPLQGEGKGGVCEMESVTEEKIVDAPRGRR